MIAEYREIKDPNFIVGMARTDTTLTARILILIQKKPGEINYGKSQIYFSFFKHKV